jgi:hypothetical protein
MSWGIGSMSEHFVDRLTLQLQDLSTGSRSDERRVQRRIDLSDVKEDMRRRLNDEDRLSIQSWEVGSLKSIIVPLKGFPNQWKKIPLKWAREGKILREISETFPFKNTQWFGLLVQ